MLNEYKFKLFPWFENNNLPPTTNYAAAEDCVKTAWIPCYHIRKTDVIVDRIISPWQCK